jgi:GTPase KRas protein
MSSYTGAGGNSGAHGSNGIQKMGMGDDEGEKKGCCGCVVM